MLANELLAISELSNSEAGRALISRQSRKVKESFETIINPNIIFKDKEAPILLLIANLDLLVELTGAKDKLLELEKSLELDLNN